MPVVALAVVLGAGPVLAAAPATAADGPASSGSSRSSVAAAVLGSLWGDKQADRGALSTVTGKRESAKDVGALSTVTEAIGARAVWRQKDAAGRPITGRGVTVGVLDSGVSAVPGLDGPGKLLRGPDLSLEASSDELTTRDTFGHGTHMAGIIGARDSAAVDPRTGALRTGDPEAQLGVAPDAQLLAFKLASTDGSADVSQIIAALDWAVEHRNDPGLNLRVVNLSFGTASVQPYQADPLAAAAENAWRHGIVVVVSGGNEGRTAGRLSNPAIDPYVIAVGAADPQYSITGLLSPVVADFSSRGTTTRHVDLVAPGRSIVSLRAPGSFVDRNHPEGRVTGDITGRLFRGSGTSQAAAVVSGAAALLLQAQPDLTPDQVKAALTSTADPVRGYEVDAGAGTLDVDGALDSVRRSVAAKNRPSLLSGLVSVLSPQVVQRHPVATGLGSLDAARGGNRLVDARTGDVLTGEVDVQGNAWNARAWAAASAAGTAWDGGYWMGARWSGDRWTSTGWARARWSGDGWSRARWSSGSWDADDWSRARWSDAGWERARWSGGAWH